jgi:subtilisin family serine protease
MRLLRPVALALLTLALAPAAARADDAAVGEQIIVRHRTGLDAAARADVRADSDTKLDRKLRLANTELVTVTDGTRAQALAALRADPDVVSAEPNTIVRTATNDPFWSYLWGLFNGGGDGMTLDADIDAEPAWTRTRGANVTVAVVDTGVQLNHPDLVGRLVPGYDFVNHDADPSDGYGHGTHVAGIIAANQGNGLGVTGIAPEARIMPLKALGDDGAGTMDAVLEAFAYAGDHGAQVVNASLGGDGDVSPSLEQVFTDHPDTLYVVAAGNSGRDDDALPTTPCVSTAPNVLCVGATDDVDTPAYFSNYGATTVDLFAPGTSILSTYTGSAYAYESGTSMATPYAAGTAALAFAATGERGADLAQQLRDSVDPIPGLTGLSVTGGRLNAARAVGAPVDAPSRPVSAVATGGDRMATVSVSSPPGDLAGVSVYDTGYHLLGSSTSSTVTVNGLAGGVQKLLVVATYADGRVSPVATATAAVTAPEPVSPPVLPPATPAPAPPPVQLPQPPRADAPAARITGVRLVTRHGRKSLVFRVTRSTRVTVTLYRYSRGHYHRSGRTTVRMAAGNRTLRVTSRLLGMRVPHGRFRVRVATVDASATVASSRR